MTHSIMKIAQVSDIHLFGDTDKELLGVNTTQSFLAVLDHLKARESQPDLLILSGDLSQDGSKAAYIKIADACKALSCPIYYLPGNHDNLQTLARVYPRENIFNDKHIIRKPWQIILLNSQKPGAVEGELSEEQFRFLEACLQKNPEEFALVVFHHHPVRLGTAWLDKLGLTNAEAFWSLVAKYPHVKVVLFGHAHQEYENTIQGIHCYGVPSTCVQFKPHHDGFELDPLPPGYRWIELYPDGKINTKVYRVDKYVGTFESKATGY